MPKTRPFEAADFNRVLNVPADVIDLRDTFYSPSLAPLRQAVVPNPDDLCIRNQKAEPTCTAFALAAVIDNQVRTLFEGVKRPEVSVRMLWEMARLHDDLPNGQFSGSTLRGALKGFYHNGVCLEREAPYEAGEGGATFRYTTDLADRARRTSLGSYFRLHHEINDYHSAIHEAGAIIVSGRIHVGWAEPDKHGVIMPSPEIRGRHAFAIVGYDHRGFLVQNSWGEGWSKYKAEDGTELPGVALWTYEDWQDNVEDAWVLRLAISSPSAFNVKFARNHAGLSGERARSNAFAPRRQDILGHYLHVEDGKLVREGRYAQAGDAVKTMREAITLARKPREAAPDRPFRPAARHLLVVGHAALQDRFEVAKRIKAWRPVFEANGIYPIHLIWETGFNNQVVNVLHDILWKTRERMGAEAEHLDGRLEALARPMGRKLWRDLKLTAGRTMRDNTCSGDAIRQLIDTATEGDPPMHLHFMGVSGGAFLLEGFANLVRDKGHVLDSVSLLAPACSLTHYDTRIRPHVGKAIRHLDQYNLSDKRERDDNVEIYGKSALYLVSRALEESEGKTSEPERPVRLLGMQSALKDRTGKWLVDLPHAHAVHCAGIDTKITNATSHHGFDRDRATMNSVLARITGHEPAENAGFRPAHLSGY